MKEPGKPAEGQLYAAATVLDYKGKKIWIKHAMRQMYCVNGRFIIFDEMPDISDASVIAHYLDYFLFSAVLRRAKRRYELYRHLPFFRRHALFS